MINNSVVSGLGDGVSDSVKGVSRGAGNIVRGSVRGMQLWLYLKFLIAISKQLKINL